MLTARHETIMRDKDNQALTEEIMLLRTRLSHAGRDKQALKGEVESLKKKIALLEEQTNQTPRQNPTAIPAHQTPETMDIAGAKGNITSRNESMNTKRI